MWQTVVVLNVAIAVCYVGISSLIALGLVRTRQLSENPLALATAAIFMTCAMHHGHHALHLITLFGGADSRQLESVRTLFGAWHSVAIDVLGAAVAIIYLGLRRNYKALLNTPAMFDDAVRVAAEQQLRDLAFTDQLTGVPNRTDYQRHADSLAAMDTPVIVLFIDLDAFKTVNDAHGHDTGDRLLRDVALRLAGGLLPGERLFRVGGDEFVVIATSAAECAPELAYRMQSLIRRPVDAREGPVVVGASIGIATGSSRAGVDHLVRDADADMYRIKNRRPEPALDLPLTGAQGEVALRSEL